MHPDPDAPPLSESAALRPFVVSATGHVELSRSACRSLRFRQPSRALRIPNALDDSVGTRAEAIRLVSRDDAVLWGPTAAELLGLPVPFRLEDADIHVLVPAGRPRPRRAGVRPRQADIVPTEILTLSGLRLTSPARTFVDLAAFMCLPDVVAVGDVAMRRYGVTTAELTLVMRRRLRYPGKVRARQAIPLLNPRAESPPESRLRVHIVEDGLPQPQVNLVIRDRYGCFLARCDLAYEEWLLAIEYDGAVHATPERRRADATRRTRLREAGWWIVEVVDEDLRNPQRAVAKVRAALLALGAI